MKGSTLINGRVGDVIDVDDHGLQYGDGLFETIAVVNGEPRRLPLHLDRLERGCVRLGIRCPPRELLVSEITSVAGSEERAVLKLILTRGADGRRYKPSENAEPTRIIRLHDWPHRPAHWWETGVAVRWCTTTLAEQPLLAGIKHLNRLEHVLARREWSDPDLTEGLLCDGRGHLICGTASNVFLVHGTTLSTPRIDRCGVAGTVRAAVLSLAPQIGLPATEKELSVPDVATAGEIFLTNALIGVWPISRIGGQQFRVGPVTRRLQKLIG